MYYFVNPLTQVAVAEVLENLCTYLICSTPIAQGQHSSVSLQTVGNKIPVLFCKSCDAGHCDTEKCMHFVIHKHSDALSLELTKEIAAIRPSLTKKVGQTGSS